MHSTDITLWVIGAVLVFWAVGAYNRLVQLRNAIQRAFDPVHAQCTLRHALLQQQIDALAPVLANAAPRLDALRAASVQAAAACIHARAQPGTAGAIGSLRLAEDILVEARSRLPVQMAAGVDLTDLNSKLAGADTALGFARQQFNDAVTAYNEAVRQFPTRLIAGVFGMRAAATL